MNCGIEVQTDKRSVTNDQELDVRQDDGAINRLGVALNNLTDYRWRYPIVGTPWHKYVPAGLERVA